MREGKNALMRTKSCRLMTMLILTLVFFLVEIVTGFVTNSLALVADAFHMLSDVIALIVGLASVRVSKWHTKKNTFGWVRAEVLGAMVNSVFLCAMCFNITLESIERFIEIEEIKNPKLILIVGSLGLAVNLIGLALFHGHGHSHGGHGHSHSCKSKTPKEPIPTTNGVTPSSICRHDSDSSEIKPAEECDRLVYGEVDVEKDGASMLPNGTSDNVDTAKTASSAQLNMRGVFLHVLGDALGSVVVIVSSLIVWFVEDDWKYYIDPAMSMVMVCIIMSTTIPLLRESGMILLQTVPTHIEVMDIKNKLEKIEGIVSVQEFHVWQLTGNRIIASAHITCSHIAEYTRVSKLVKDIFHAEGIHSTTIEPEFLDKNTT